MALVEERRAGASTRSSGVGAARSRCRSSGPSGATRRRLVAGEHGVVGQLDGRRRDRRHRPPPPGPGTAAGGPAPRAPARGSAAPGGGIGPVLDLGDRVRVVGEPPLHPDAPHPDRDQRPAAVRQLGRLHDARHRARPRSARRRRRPRSPARSARRRTRGRRRGSRRRAPGSGARRRAAAGPAVGHAAPCPAGTSAARRPPCSRHRRALPWPAGAGPPPEVVERRDGAVGRRVAEAAARAHRAGPALSGWVTASSVAVSTGLS